MATCIDFGASEGRDRFIRFTRLLIVGGTPILRKVLKLKHSPTTLAAALAVTRIGFTKPQKQRVFPDPPGSLPNFDDFDISLIFKLLRNCCGLTEPVTRWNELPVESDVSLEADIIRIDYHRNEVYGHSLEDMQLTCEDFHKYWNITSDALCRIVTDHLSGAVNVTTLQGLQGKIEDLKFSPLTNDDRHMVEEEHLRNIESNLAEQSKKLDNIEAKEDQIKEGIEGLQDTMINALHRTKISGEKTLSASAPVHQHNTVNLTFNQFSSPSFSSESPQGPPPRRFSEGASTQRNLQKPYHKSYSQPSNIGHRGFPSQDRYANQEELQFQPPADEYQQGCNVWQGSNQTEVQVRDSLFYVDQDNAPDPQLLNEMAAATTRMTSERLASEPSNVRYRDDRQTASHATTRSTPCNQGIFDKPYNTRMSRDNRHTALDATWTTPTNQGLPGTLYKARQDRQTPPADARQLTTHCDDVFSHGSCHTRTRDDTYRQTSPKARTWDTTVNPWVVSSKYECGSRQQQDFDPLLHIKISVHGAGSLDHFHFGNVVQSGIDGSNQGADISQFTSYLKERRQLIIKKIEGDIHSNSCFIEVSPRDLKSLEELWHDYIVQDLREFVKETVLPEGFRGDVSVNIDGEEYKRCCERLRPRGFKDSGRQLHSQSFSQVNTPCDVTIQRSQSVMDLPSTLKNASEELLQLICLHGGRMDWQMAKQNLTNTSYMELTKPAFQQNMNRYLEFLDNNDVQVRLRFCPKMRKDSTCSNTNCPDLHLCIYHFLDGSCNFPTNCKNSHVISDEHTNNVFRMANLSFLDDEGRKRLLRNIAYVVPEICMFYNKPRDSCTKGSNCSYLHICRDWVLDGRVCTAAAGTRCHRAHTFSYDHEQHILKKKNLDQMSEKEIMRKLNEHYR